MCLFFPLPVHLLDCLLAQALKRKRKKKKRSNFESAMPGLLLGFSAAYTFHYTRIVAARAKVVGAESKRDDAMDRPVVPLSCVDLYGLG
ncbi:hypothetical protein BKA81DRAFT_368707 [Phyllosticta paracitricarpa]